MPRWSALTDALNGTTAERTFTWDELAALVGPLPPSATRHRAWWSGDRPHVHSWKAAGFRLKDVSLGQLVTFASTLSSASSNKPAFGRQEPRLQVRSSVATEEPSHGRILLISCAKTKSSKPAAAKDLYTSPLFTSARAHAEQIGGEWFILSAEHGLVGPEEWLAPYERYLPDTPPDFRDAWGRWVVARLALLVGPLAQRVVEVHAGTAYVAPIEDLLRTRGAHVALPLKGLTVGQRLSWYAHQAGGDPSADGAAGASLFVGSDSTGTAETFAAVLRDEERAITPAQFVAQGPGHLRVPGLYSWWTDEQGAADLTAGLGLAIGPGMIYAGLAGATRWPSGKRSTNTLWSRITGMHLGKRHEFSTFRRSLGAIQAHRVGSADVDEDVLTLWMREHLRVVAVPHADADTLGQLETEVLRLLDPPLNLQGMRPTEVRRRLSELRKRLR